MQEQFVEMLARIHETPQSVLPSYTTGEEAARAEVAVCRRRLLETELLPSPIIRHALDVLDRTLRRPSASRCCTATTGCRT